MKEKLRQISWALALVLVGSLFITRSGNELLLQQLGVLAWKLVLVGSSIAVAHVVRKQLFPYIDLSELTKRRLNIGPGLIFLGIAIVYAAIILAVCSGL